MARAAVQACAGASLLCLLASLVLRPPAGAGGMAGWHGFDQSGRAGASLLALLPYGAALAGVAAAAGGLLWAGRMETASLRQEAVAWLATLSDLRAFLAEQRGDQAAFRQEAGQASRQSAELGARLASAVLDAEARLSDAAARAERMLMHPSGPLMRVAQSSARLEQGLPALQEEILAGLEAVSARMAAPADTPALAASEQVAAALRRDAGALTVAGREIALAGAGLLHRLGEAAARVEQAGAGLPDAAASVQAASGALQRTAAESADRLIVASEHAASGIAAALAEIHDRLAMQAAASGLLVGPAADTMLLAATRADVAELLVRLQAASGQQEEAARALAQSILRVQQAAAAAATA
jgi:hypothetical protein